MFFKYLLLVELFHYYALWTELVNAHPRLPPVFKIPLPQFRFRISHERVWKFIWRYISNKEKITISNLYVTPSYLLSSWLLEVSAEGHIHLSREGSGMWLYIPYKPDGADGTAPDLVCGSVLDPFLCESLLEPREKVQIWVCSLSVLVLRSFFCQLLFWPDAPHWCWVLIGA